MISDFSKKELVNLIWSRPNFAQIELTRNCNFKCKFCFENCDAKDKYEDKPVEMWKKVIDNLHELGLKKLHFSGGENFLYPHFKEILKYSKEKGFVNLINTNGSFNIEKILTSLQDTKKQQFALKEKYYTHSPKSLETFSKILKDNAITSVEYGKHDGGSGCNGKNFISVARVNSDAYNTYAGSKTFILTDNICAFSQTEFNQLDLVTQFKDSKYPFRSPTYSGELHVLDKINLDKAIGIFVSQNRIDELVQIVYLQELFQNEIPLIQFEDNTYIDRDVIKKYSKVLK